MGVSVYLRISFIRSSNTSISVCDRLIRYKNIPFLSQASIDALMRLSIENKKPIGNGIITCLNKRQAIARKNKGREAAQAVISVLSQK